jgi:hypothetical protein
LHALEHELARQVVVRAILERQLDHRQTEDGARPPRDHERRVVQGPLDRHRHLLLDFLGGEARIQRDDHHGGIREIGIRLNLELAECPDAGTGEDERRGDDDEAAREREPDELVDHDGWRSN